MITNNFEKGYFILGTDTDIGKTYISSLLFKSLLPESVGYYKPLQTGCPKIKNKLVPLDASFLCKFSDIKLKEEMSSYLFNTPVSPHLAAELDNVTIDISNVKKHFEILKSLYEILIVEGAGGLYVPIIRNEYYMFNLIKDLNLPVILVCSSKVGCINHTLLTIEFLKTKNIKIHGIIFNKFTNEFYENDNIDIVLKESNMDNYLVIKENQNIIPKIELYNFLNKKN